MSAKQPGHASDCEARRRRNRIENVTDPGLVEPIDAILRVTRACIWGSDLWPYASMQPSETGQSMGDDAIGIVENLGA